MFQDDWDDMVAHAYSDGKITYRYILKGKHGNRMAGNIKASNEDEARKLIVERYGIIGETGTITFLEGGR